MTSPLTRAFSINTLVFLVIDCLRVSVSLYYLLVLTLLTQGLFVCTLCLHTLSTSILESHVKCVALATTCRLYSTLVHFCKQCDYCCRFRIIDQAWPSNEAFFINTLCFLIHVRFYRFT